MQLETKKDKNGWRLIFGMQKDLKWKQFGENKYLGDVVNEATDQVWNEQSFTVV